MEQSKAAERKTTYINIPEAIDVFDTFDAQQAAFYHLRSVGFHYADISLLGSQSSLAASIEAIAIVGSPAAVLGTLLARRVGQHHKDYY
jgi:hypothetical protein